MEILKGASAYFALGELPPRMIYPVVRELAADGAPVATACRVLQVSASGFYDWLGREPSALERSDAALSETIAAVHAASYGPTAPAGCTPNCAWAATFGSVASAWSG